MKPDRVLRASPVQPRLGLSIFERPRRAVVSRTRASDRELVKRVEDQRARGGSSGGVDCTTRIAPKRSTTRPGSPFGFGMAQGDNTAHEQLLAAAAESAQAAGKKALKRSAWRRRDEQTRCQAGYGG